MIAIFDFIFGLVAKVADIMILNIKGSLMAVGVIFSIIIAVEIIGNMRPSYSQWYRIAQFLNRFATVMIWVLIIALIVIIVFVVLAAKDSLDAIY